MNTKLNNFNTFFNFIAIFSGIICLAIAVNGCKSTPEETNADGTIITKDEEKAQKAKEKEESKKLSLTEIYLETPKGSNTEVHEVQVFRAWPETISVSRKSFLDSRDFQSVSILKNEEDNTFQIEYILTAEGSSILQNITGRYRGRRMIIFANFGDPRYLGAPKIDKVITDGRIVITPDASLEEAERYILGMRNTIRTIKKRDAGL